MNTHIDYAVQTRAGVIAFTSPEKALAVRWAKDRMTDDEGLALTVVEVSTTVTKRRVWGQWFQLARVA